MFIHTVKQGETVFHIARKYGVNPTKIIENNGLRNPDRISVGQKLVILTPTRTYTVRGGDTLGKISKRFGVAERSLLRSNPQLSGIDATYPEEVLAIKYDTPTHGMAVLNGYYYKGCPHDRLMLALPYCSCITVSAYKAGRSGALETIFDDKDVVRTAKDHGNIPIMRIYDPREYKDVLPSAKDYRSEIIKTAKKRGYGGVALGAYKAAKDVSFRSFLFELRKEMMNENLTLIYELDKSDDASAEMADRCVLLYEKCYMENIPTFEDGERKFYTDFAEKQDSTKTFMDLSAFAYAGGEGITKQDAEELAFKMKKSIEYDPERMVCSFDYTRYGGMRKENTKVFYDSLENIKAKLDLASELGFMGISFDIMRVPTEHLMMMSTSFCCGSDYALSSFEI